MKTVCEFFCNLLRTLTKSWRIQNSLRSQAFAAQCDTPLMPITSNCLSQHGEEPCKGNQHQLLKKDDLVAEEQQLRTGENNESVQKRLQQPQEQGKESITCRRNGLCFSQSTFSRITRLDLRINAPLQDDKETWTFPWRPPPSDCFL